MIFWVWGPVAAPPGCQPHQLRQAVLPPPPQALVTAQAVLVNRCRRLPQPQVLVMAQAVLVNRCHHRRQAPNRPELATPLVPWGNHQACHHLRQMIRHELVTVPATRHGQKAARQPAICPNPTLVQLRAAHRREICPNLILAQPLVQEVLGLHPVRELRLPR